MPTEFKLPDIGEGTAEGEIIKWLVAEGDEVAEDTPLVEVMTDKATVEIPSPQAGKILELRAKEGDVVDVGAVILVFGQAGEEVPAASEPDDTEPAAAVPEAESDAPTTDVTSPVPGQDADRGPELSGGIAHDHSWWSPDVRGGHGPSIQELAADSMPAQEDERSEEHAQPAASSGSEQPELQEQPAGPVPAHEPDVAESAAPDAEVVEAARAMARAELEQAGPVEVAETSRKVWEAPAPVAGRGLATPATRRLARDLGIDLTEVSGSGKDGRIMKEDVLAFAEAASRPEPLEPDREEAPAMKVAEPEPEPEAEPVPPSALEPEVVEAAPVPVVAAPAEPAQRPEPAPEPPAPHPASTPAPAPAPQPGAEAAEERIPFRGLRRRIAAKMAQAKRTAPHFTYVEECDMTEIVALRQRAKSIGAPHGIRVTYLPFIVRALVESLKLHPQVNASLDEEAGEIVIKHYYNVGIATATDRGLIVPVIHDADKLGVFDLAREIERLATEAREGRSRLQDLQGGTITITSTGNIGGVLATPIINTPEVAILGVTAIRKRPVVRHGEIVVREMVNFSLSLDHRVVDGADGALFLRDMISVLEDPKLLLLGSP